MRKRELVKKLVSVSLAAVLAFGTPMANLPFFAPVTDEVYAAQADYGLMEDIQDGTILHCFDWKYTDIITELPNIAEAGFTSIQTSPAQRAGGETWYWLYQPQSFTIGGNACGTRDDLKRLCEEADKYGIKIIVDVVANHLRGEGTNVDANISSSNHSDYFRWNNKTSPNVNWKDRNEVTTCNIGMRDLNSENKELQNIILAYINDLKSIGVDGIRWDAAKHIAIPSEGSDFWPTMASSGLYNYGEILEGPNNGGNGNDAKMKEYTDYISVTDDKYGDDLSLKIHDNGVLIANHIGNYSEKGVPKNKLVYWAESHDTYSNNGEYGKESQTYTQNEVDRAYAFLAAQSKATSLYFSRPSSTTKESILAGQKGSTHFTSKEVAEVNKFHNAMNGNKEYDVVKSDYAVVCREKGAVIVLSKSKSGQVTVNNGDITKGGTEPGEYIDQVSGNKFTVTATSITGTVGSTGIAVLYDPDNLTKLPSVSVSKETSDFYTDTIDVTLTLRNATSGTYKIDNGDAVTFTSDKTLTLGADTPLNGQIKLTVTATGEGGTSEPATYTYTKKELVGNVAYFKKPSGWGDTVKCYAYDSATESVKNADWPGVEMTYDSATDLYYYIVPENIEAPRVIFYNTDTNRTPADQEKGY